MHVARSIAGLDQRGIFAGLGQQLAGLLEAPTAQPSDLERVAISLS